MSKILSYSIEMIPPDKTMAIWVLMEPNNLMPLCYLRKPKWLSDDQWDAVLSSIRFQASAQLLDLPEAGE